MYVDQVVFKKKFPGMGLDSLEVRLGQMTRTHAQEYSSQR